MKKIIFFIFCVLASFYLSGQTLLTQYEYWFDDDYQSKTMESISPTTTYNLKMAIDCGQIEDGLHVFNIHFKDNSGIWSSTVSQYFQKLTLPQLGNLLVTQYEYWFDNDYPSKTKVSISPTTTYNLKTILDCEQIGDGLHVFNVRFKDNFGYWNSTVSQSFQKMTISQMDNVLVLGEYWLNDNRNETRIIEIESTAAFVLFEDIDISSATKATNIIHYRFKDKFGSCSSVYSSYFYRPIEAAFTHIVNYYDVSFTNNSQYADNFIFGISETAIQATR